MNISVRQLAAATALGLFIIGLVLAKFTDVAAHKESTLLSLRSTALCPNAESSRKYVETVMRKTLMYSSSATFSPGNVTANSLGQHTSVQEAGCEYRITGILNARMTDGIMGAFDYIAYVADWPNGDSMVITSFDMEHTQRLADSR